MVQGTLLRGTIHLVSREDYWPFAVAVRSELRDWFVKVSKGDPSQAELERAAKIVQATLHHRPLRQTEIDELVGRRNRAGINMVLDIVRIPPSGTWERRRADLHADAEGWLGPPDVSVLDAQVLLVRRYLGGFGPATRAEIANWAGLPVRSVAAALDRIDHVTYPAEDGSTLVDLPDAPLPDPASPVPVRFLPTWDATLLVHARRARILPEATGRGVQHQDPTLGPDIPGRRVSRRHLAIRGRPGRAATEFDPLSRRVRREAEQAADALAAFHR